MWYRTQQSEEGAKSYEVKIVRSCAERAARRLLRLLKRNYHPSQREIDQLVKRAMNALREEYGSLSAIRRQIDGESLTPVVESAVRKLIR